MRYRFIEVEKATYSIALMCRVLQVSRGGYYAWRMRPESARSRSDRKLLVDIRAAHKASRCTYGSPRMQRELLAQGHCVGRHRVARLMRLDGLRGRRGGASARPPSRTMPIPWRRTSSSASSLSRPPTKPG